LREPYLSVTEVERWRWRRRRPVKTVVVAQEVRSVDDGGGDRPEEGGVDDDGGDRRSRERRDRRGLREFWDKK
jgi:hypothetical protein